jgi:hypothetical protein
MKEPRNHLPLDLKALRYLDALDAGDLEAVAALWDEASRDPQLERTLAELDDALFVEGAGANGKADAERIQSLIPKRLPSGLPAPRPLASRGRWAGVVGGLAAACLLAFFTWPGRDGKNPVPSPPTNESAQQVATRPPDDHDRIAAWRQYRRALDGGELPAFTWPLQGDFAQLGISLDSSQHARLNERNRSL